MLFLILSHYALIMTLIHPSSPFKLLNQVQQNTSLKQTSNTLPHNNYNLNSLGYQPSSSPTHYSSLSSSSSGIQSQDHDLGRKVMEDQNPSVNTPLALANTPPALGITPMRLGITPPAQIVGSQRLLLQCTIKECLNCIKPNFTELCIVCRYPMMPNTALNQCQVQENSSNSSVFQCSILNCQACQTMTLGIIKQQVCTQCDVGYRFLILEGKCYPKSALEDSQEIISYGDYYYLCQEGCTKCEPSTTIELCLQCRSGYSMIEGMYTCVKCIYQCKTCQTSSPENCLSCFPGFTLKNNSCLKCTDEVCQSCSSENTSLCTSCKNGYFLKQDSCVVCQQDCRRCENSSKCLTCEDGFMNFIYGNGTTECVRCQQQCSSCEDLSTCTKCFPGHFLDANSSCRNCKLNCVSCNSADTCFKCLPGFDLFGNTCVKQKENCILMNFNGSCKVCMSQYELTSSGDCLLNLNGYDTNMVTLACKYGMFPQNYWCYRCTDAFPNCLQCNSAYCWKCVDGFYLTAVNYTCIKCQSSACKVCQTAAICLQCKDKFYLQQDISQNGTLEYGVCKACSQRCLTCYSKANHCTSCNAGFRLSLENTCEAGYNLNFTVSLNFNYKVSPQKLSLVRRHFSNFVVNSTLTSQQKSAKIKITKISEGSTLIEGYVETDDNQTLKTTYKSFSESVTAGSTANGVEIISVSWSAVQPDPPGNTNPLPIILGSVLGGSGAVIIFVVIIYYCKRYRDKQDEESKKDSETDAQQHKTKDNEKKHAQNKEEEVRDEDKAPEIDKHSNKQSEGRNRSGVNSSDVKLFNPYSYI